MILAGKDPMGTGENGTSIREMQPYLPGSPPSPVNETNFDADLDERPQYDFSSIQMVIDNCDASEVVPIEILNCHLLSPDATGANVRKRLWKDVAELIGKQKHELQASWWLAWLTYHCGTEHAETFEWIRSKIAVRQLPASLLNGNGLRPIKFPKGPLTKEEAFKPSDDNPEPVAKTTWTPKVKGINGFQQYFYHPGEEEAQLDTRIPPM